MIHINGKIIIPSLYITDSFIDFTLFRVGSTLPTMLNRAAIIPLEEYARQLQAAEDYEQLKVLQPLADALEQRELKILDNAQIDKDVV